MVPALKACLPCLIARSFHPCRGTNRRQPNAFPAWQCLLRQFAGRQHIVRRHDSATLALDNCQRTPTTSRLQTFSFRYLPGQKQGHLCGWPVLSCNGRLRPPKTEQLSDAACAGQGGRCFGCLCRPATPSSGCMLLSGQSAKVRGNFATRFLLSNRRTKPDSSNLGAIRSFLPGYLQNPDTWRQEPPEFCR